MNATMTANTGQWMMQFYQQPLMDGLQDLAPSTEGFSNATVVTTSPSPTMSSPEGISLSPATTSYTTSGHLTTPKGTALKPIRRRSRASKRTPTTLLKANTTNFRALVQKFTGCPSTNTPFAVHKGPITLNFQQGRSQQIHHNTTRVMPPFGTTSYSNQAQKVAAPLPWQNQPTEQLPKQQWLDYVKSNNFFPSSGNTRPGMEVSDHGLLMDNDFSLHELTVNAFSNEIKNDGYFM